MPAIQGSSVYTENLLGALIVHISGLEILQNVRECSCAFSALTLLVGWSVIKLSDGVPLWLSV